jgi:outer membrane lipoprotein-sorting protein
MKILGLSRVSFLSASLALLLTVIGATHVLAEGLGNPKQFTVEMKMTATSGGSEGEAMTMQYFVGKNRLRMEMKMDGGQEGGIHISLHDGDQVTSYMLIPQMKMYMKSVSGEGGMMDEEEEPTLTFGSPDDADHPCKSDPDVTCKKIGSDTIIGRAVDKYLVTDVEDGTPIESTIWFDRELLFPIKVEDSEGIMEALSIEVGKQPDELFEIPADYREMSM